jgi:hypothetical protein
MVFVLLLRVDKISTFVDWQMQSEDKMRSDDAYDLDTNNTFLNTKKKH